jgi:hypothetical protein
LEPSGIIHSLTKGLLSYLRTHIPSIQQAFDEFPNPSQTLKYPAVSVFLRNPTFTPMMTYVVSKGAELPSGKRPVRRVVGMYDFSLQLDLWAESKPARFKLLNDFFLAMHHNYQTHGISLQLPDYFNEWVRFDLAGVEFVGDEGASQRAEWRVKADLLANAKAIVESQEFVIETIENNLETPPEIAPPPKPPVDLII